MECHRQGGTIQTASDATSIATYDEHSEALPDLPILSDADALAIATANVAKFKDPFARIRSLQLNTLVANVAEAALNLEIGTASASSAPTRTASGSTRPCSCRRSAWPARTTGSRGASRSASAL